MSKFFNVDINKMMSDYELSYRTAGDKFRKEYTEKCDAVLKNITYKLQEHHNNLKQIAIEKKLVEETDNKIDVISEKIKLEKQHLESDVRRLELVKNECKALELQEKNAISSFNTTKNDLDHMINEKKSTIKELKRGIREFKFGVDLYENLLQLSMKIENKGQNDEIHVTLMNSNSHIIHTIIFVELDSKSLELIDIIPHTQSSRKAAELFHASKSFKRLLTFLWNEQKKD